MEYGYTKKVNGTFLEVVEKAKGALATEGFGILTEIDVQATLKKKLNAEHPPYLILGACNPPLAYRALQAEKKVGLLLPCNVIVYEDEGNIFVSSILPTVAMGMVDDPVLALIAREVEQKLKKVIDSIE
ncbi:MAG: DUF302 domain-containing protein [Candidatus Moraniibacteriota bacterium]